MGRTDFRASRRIAVSAANSTELPVWVYKRNGRLVPFEADKISQALFATSDGLGRPDAFLARELTDSVLHFLSQEYAGTIPSTVQIAEWVVKVVRELGEPELARAFALYGERRQRTAREKEAPRPLRIPEETLRFQPHEPFSAFLRRCRQEYGLRTVFSRDLLAAQKDGLLTLTGLDSPLELKGCVLDASTDEPLEVLLRSRELAGDFVAIDGPEHALADAADTTSVARKYVRQVVMGLRLTGLRALVHLNGAGAPPWADELAIGPLFATQQRPTAEALRRTCEALFEEWTGSPAGECVELHWHLGERDFSDTHDTEWRHRLARHALENPRLTFAFDRPKRPFALGEGLDRKHTAVLLAVGLHLPRLAQLPGVSEMNFLQKLGSLARLAVSAAVQKRDFLRHTSRERPALAGRFLLDRARLVVVPVGLEAVVQTLLGRGLSSGKPVTEWARRLLQSLQQDLLVASRTYRLECCLDEGSGFAGYGEVARDGPRELAGLSCWDPSPSLRCQVRTAGALHAVAQGGTALVVVPAEKTPSCDELVNTVQYAWQQTDVARLRFVRPATRSPELSLLHL
jgi:hypothetical protein